MLVLFISIVLLSVVWTTYKYGIGPTPTSFKVKAAFLKTLPKIDSGHIYELGAGWGNLAFALADHYPSNSVFAIEVSPVPWIWLSLRQFLFPRPNLTIVYGDLFKKNLLGAELIVCYLCHQMMRPLEKKLDTECPQAWVMTHTFALPLQKADQTVYVEDLYHTPIYIYERRNRRLSQGTERRDHRSL